MIEPGCQVQFHRDCEVVEIPAGTRLRVPEGTAAIVTQCLGGTVTLRLSATGALVRLDGKDIDAIGLEATPGVSPVEGGDLESRVWEALKTCYDPEIPVNIVDLGLVYDLRLEPAPDGGYRVGVKMTLTAPGCGMGTVIARDAEEKLRALPDVKEARVEIVWDPPWSPQMISPEGRARLGI
jgi:probable FeS assembly SUF system protein SufT